ncbi:MAG: hypothetical protein ACKVU1_05195 [bacterium]
MKDAHGILQNCAAAQRRSRVLRIVFIATALAAMLVCSASTATDLAFAQATPRTADILVPFDADRGLIWLGPEEARALELASPRGNIVDVRIFAARPASSAPADSALVMEIVWLEGAEFVRERRAITRGDLASMRARVAAAAAASAALGAPDAPATPPIPSARPAVPPRLAAGAHPPTPPPPPPGGLDPSVAADTRDAPARLSAGRASLLTGSAILSLGFYSWVVPVALNLDARAAVGTGMLSAASGYFVPLLLTGRENVTTGMSNLAFYGGTRGIVHGLAIHDWIAGEDADYFYDDLGLPALDYDDNGDDSRFGATAIGSVCEGVAGYFWARQAGLDAGRTQTIAVAGDFGILWGLGAAELLDDDVDDERRLRGAAITLASAATLAGGALVAERRDYSWGDAEVVRTTGLVAAGLAAATYDLADGDDDDGGRDAADPFVTAAMAASLAGIVVGDRLVADAEFSAGQALLADLGTLAGGALGLAAAYLVTRDTDDSAPFTLGAALGGVGGFALTYRLTRPDAVRRAPPSHR